jgi:WD40 repeat protein
LKQKLGTHGDSVTWLSYTGNGSLLFSGSRDNGVIKIWDLATGKPRQTIDLGGKYGQNTFYPLLARSLDGTTLVTVRQRETKVGKLTVNEGGDLAAWDTSTGKVRWNLEDSRVQGLTLSSDGKKVAGWVHRIDKWIPEGDDRARASGEKNQLVIWDSNTGKPEKTVDLESGFFQALAYLPGNQVLVFLHQSKVIFRDAATGTVQREIKLDTSRWAFSSFAFSPDGKTLARSWSDYVELANLETGAVGGLLTTKFPENLFQVAFSPDLKRVACTQQGPVVFDLVPAKP